MEWWHELEFRHTLSSLSPSLVILSGFPLFTVSAPPSRSSRGLSIPSPSAANSLLGGAFSYSTALAELDEVKRRSWLMTTSATASKAGTSPPLSRPEERSISEAVPPAVHPWEDDLAWQDLGAFAKVCRGAGGQGLFHSGTDIIES